MPGVLLDTNAMVWYLNGAPIAPAAVFAIAQAQLARELYVSPMTGWEAALALRKRNPARRPDLLGQD
jgi:PIN domain nuclease of toxin-antitoxin system